MEIIMTLLKENFLSLNRKIIFLSAIAVLVSMHISCYDLERNNETDPGGNNFTVTLPVPEDTNVTNSEYNDKIVVTWTCSNNYAERYHILRSQVENGIYTEIGTSTENEYTDTTAETGIFYYYKIKGYSSLTPEPYSELSIAGRGVYTEIFINNEGIVFKKIPSTTFQMGEEAVAEPVHAVVLTSSFYVSKYEVAYGEWLSVKTWAIGNGYDDLVSSGIRGNDGTGESGTDLEPVTSMSWYDAVKWCNALSEKEGLIPCYYTDSGKGTVYRTPIPPLPEIAIAPDCVNWNATGYRLLTEAEWEHSARAGTITTFYWGNGSTSSYIDKYAWYLVNSGNTTHAVGNRSKNNFGLFDMAGNVREWCWDWDGEYTSSTETDPRGENFGTYRTIRGGSYFSQNFLLSSASRNGRNHSATETSNSTGFRICKKAD
jgi:formylglycine-generating enzyme required for sulfatase activity